MPALAAGGSYALPVEPARNRFKRFSPRIAQRIDDRQNVAGKLIGDSICTLRPSLPASAMLLGLPSTPPFTFRAASAALVRSEISYIRSIKLRFAHGCVVPA